MLPAAIPPKWSENEPQTMLQVSGIVEDQGLPIRKHILSLIRCLEVGEIL